MPYIYQIVNTNNGRRYIGQTRRYSHRVSCHVYDLRHGRHRCELLQSDYDEDPQSIRFEVVCRCSEAEVDELERFFISKYETIESGYNTSPGKSDGGGNIVSESTRAKSSKAKLGNQHMRGKRLSDVWRRHLSEAQPHKKAVRCIETGEVFESFADAARKTGLNRTKIVSVCTGKRKSTGGMHFEYASKQDS